MICENPSFRVSNGSDVVCLSFSPLTLQQTTNPQHPKQINPHEPTINYSYYIIMLVINHYDLFITNINPHNP